MLPSLRTLVIATKLLAPTIAAAQSAHPDLSGTWVMDPAKSEQGPLTPQAMTYTVKQSGNTLVVGRNVTTQQSASSSTLTYGLDGKVWKNTFTQDGIEIHASSTLSWDGPTLVIHTTLQLPDQSTDQTDRWTLGPDGKTLLVSRHVEVTGQELNGKLTFVRKS